MLTGRKKYPILFGQVMLLVGYLFFFAAQFNGRYFGIANFYVFELRSNGAANSSGLHHPLVVLDDDSHQPAHLAIDKRFQPNHGIRVLQIHAPHAPYNVVALRRIAPPSKVYSAIESPTNALRGPPSF